MDVEIDGEVVFYLSGGGTLPRLTLNGSVSGNGTILLKDQGGITFAGTNNTFSGEVRIGYQSNGALPIRVQVGNGPHFSWGNAEFTGFNLPRHEFVLNTHSNVTFSCAIPSNGKVYKMGFGTVTLTQTGRLPSRPICPRLSWTAARSCAARPRRPPWRA